MAHAIRSTGRSEPVGVGNAPELAPETPGALPDGYLLHKTGTGALRYTGPPIARQGLQAAPDA